MLRKKQNYSMFFFKFLKLLFFKNYILFQKTSFLIKPWWFFKKLYLHTGCFSKFFIALPKHSNKNLGMFKITRKLYNSAVALRKLKR